MSDFGQVVPQYGHFVAKSCAGEFCSLTETNLTTGTEEPCGAEATHKVEESASSMEPMRHPVSGAMGAWRHPLTSYICCRHYRSIMGPAAPCKRWPLPSPPAS